MLCFKSARVCKEEGDVQLKAVKVHHLVEFIEWMKNLRSRP